MRVEVDVKLIEIETLQLWYEDFRVVNCQMKPCADSSLQWIKLGTVKVKDQNNS